MLQSFQSGASHNDTPPFLHLASERNTIIIYNQNLRGNDHSKLIKTEKKYFLQRLNISWTGSCKNYLNHQSMH